MMQVTVNRQLLAYTFIRTFTDPTYISSISICCPCINFLYSFVFCLFFFVVVYFLWDSVCLESPYPDNDMIFMAFSRFAHDIDQSANREPLILVFFRCCTKFHT